MDTERVAETFVELADTLVDAFDVLDLLHLLAFRCVELLDVDEAAILLKDITGHLRGTVATSPGAQMLGEFQVGEKGSPVRACHRTGAAVSIDPLDKAKVRWPGFAKEATRRGFTSFLALPMRLRSDTIGILCLFSKSGTLPVGPREARVAQAMADAATIAILQYQLTEERRMTSQQLERALDSRVVIEQGKGVLASRLRISETEAFELLRQRARSTRRRLTEVADEVRRRGPDTDWTEYRHADSRRAGEQDA